MSWQEFKKKTASIDQQYNRRWLKTEYDHTVASANMTEKWQQFQKDKDLYPNLQYKTVHDGKVRPAHRPLHNIIKPIDDPFWDKYYPPNGWRCRCYVIQTMGDAKGQLPEREIVKPDFHGNVGKTGEVFNDKNPFFEMAAAAGSKKLKEALEKAKLKAPYTKAYKAENGAVVEVSPFAHLDDYKDNFKVAKILADNRISVKIRPHILIDKEKNPEYEIEGKLADRKAPLSLNFKNVFRKASKQGSKIVVLDLSQNEGDIKNITDKIESMLLKKGAYPNVEKVIIVFKDKKINIVKRKKAIN